MNDEHLDSLICGHLHGTLTHEERHELEQRLLHSAADRERFWQEAETHAMLHEVLQTSLGDEMMPKASRARKVATWLSWRPIAAAAAAGLAIGMFCTSVLLAYTQPRSPVMVNKVLPVADGSFESGSQIPAQGIPSHAGGWSGDFSRVVMAEDGITPKQGRRMLRILRADHEMSSEGARSYVGSVAQVIDLRPLRADWSDREQLVEVSAQFNAIPLPQGGLYDFNVKAAAFRGDIAEAPTLWSDHEASVSRSARTVAADSGAATWQSVAVPLVVPLDADFLVIEAAVVFKGEQSAQSVAEFPGHYVDEVEVRLTGSAHAWAIAHNAN